MAYLIDHKPRIDQFAARTRWKSSRPTGLIVLHTAEGILDTIGPDTGAEATAEFIRTRTSYGSYHDIVDSDSVVNLVPYELAAYQDGTGSNGFGLSISFACKTSDWARMAPEKRRGFLRNGAIAFVRQQAWLTAHGYPRTPLWIVSKAASDLGAPGLIYHGHRDPGRRTDPGVAPPHEFPLTEFINECRALLSGGDPTGGFLMALNDAEQKRLYQAVLNLEHGAGVMGATGRDADGNLIGKPMKTEDTLLARARDLTVAIGSAGALKEWDKDPNAFADKMVINQLKALRDQIDALIAAQQS